MERSVFVQIGATRDGLDPYLQPACRRSLISILIETPEYIQLRDTLGYQPFDQVIALPHPADTEAVLAALQPYEAQIALILAGFERYTGVAYEVAKRLQKPPASAGSFAPLTKFLQRKRVGAVNISQPRYWVQTSEQLRETVQKLPYPLVIKPVDGGGGLGVFLARTVSEATDAIAEIDRLTNFDGGQFQGIIVEEYIPGPEYSVQGMVYDGQVQILTLCTKLSRLEPYQGTVPLLGFREIGHVAQAGNTVDAQKQQFAQRVMDALQYENGPFHIDLIEQGEQFYFIEAGFRLSGGRLVNLVKTVTGVDWGEAVVGQAVDQEREQELAVRGAFGQINLMSEAELELAQQLQREGHPLQIEPLPKRSTAAESQLQASDTLLADRLRHKVPLARVQCYGAEVGYVLNVLKHCVPDALQNGESGQALLKIPNYMS